jgi:uncharacterized protein YndB with AHSA1/START domain
MSTTSAEGESLRASTTLQVRRIFRAPRARVFRAWTDPREIELWCSPGEGWSVAQAQWDLRIGGNYRITMQSPGGEAMTVAGTFRDVQPPERLVYTWSWEGQLADFGETLVTVEFRELGSSTEIILTHELFPTEDVRDFHQWGWSGSLARLEKLFQ